MKMMVIKHYAHELLVILVSTADVIANWLLMYTLSFGWLKLANYRIDIDIVDILWLLRSL